MTPEARFQDNVRRIGAALAHRKNNGMELFELCCELVKQPEMRRVSPLSVSLIEEACDRYRRDNFESQLAAVAEEMRNA